MLLMIFVIRILTSNNCAAIVSNIHKQMKSLIEFLYIFYSINYYILNSIRLNVWDRKQNVGRWVETLYTSIVECKVHE